MRCREAPNVITIPRSDDGGIELERGGDDERIHGMTRGKLRAAQEGSSALSNPTRQIEHDESAPVEQMIDGRVEARSPAYLGEHRSRHPHERASIVRHSQDRTGPFRVDAAFGRVREGVQRLCVQNQRFGHARLAFANAAAETGPRASSSCERKSRSCSRSNSCAMARATNPDNPRAPTRRRTAAARSTGTLIESLAADGGID
jgi:hypothetical protein